MTEFHAAKKSLPTVGSALLCHAPNHQQHPTTREHTLPLAVETHNKPQKHCFIIVFENSIDGFTHMCTAIKDLTHKHPRVNILQPGCNVGGHGIAVVPYFITSKYPEESKIIATATTSTTTRASGVPRK